MKVIKEIPSKIQGCRGVNVYSIKCDICGNPLMLGKGKKKVIGEFLSWGQEEMEAEARGWICEGGTEICVDCLKSIGGKRK